MSSEKKDVGAEAAPVAIAADDSGPTSTLDDPEAAERRRRKKRAGLRVPSDAVPRPRAQSPAEATVLPGGDRLGANGGGEAMPPIPTQRDADIEVDIELSDDDEAAAEGAPEVVRPVIVPVGARQEEPGEGPKQAAGGAATSAPVAAASEPPARDASGGAGDLTGDGDASRTQPEPASSPEASPRVQPVESERTLPSLADGVEITITDEGSEPAADAARTVPAPRVPHDGEEPEELDDEDVIEERGEGAEARHLAASASPSAPAAAPRPPPVPAPGEAGAPAATGAGPDVAPEAVAEATARSEPTREDAGAAPGRAAAEPDRAAATDGADRSAEVVEVTAEPASADEPSVDGAGEARGAARPGGPASPASAGDAAPAEEAEELSPSEIEEVDSGPHPASGAQPAAAASPPAAAPQAPAAQPGGAAPAGSPHGSGPIPAVHSTPPPVPPPSAGSVPRPVSAAPARTSAPAGTGSQAGGAAPARAAASAPPMSPAAASPATRKAPPAPPPKAAAHAAAAAAAAAASEPRPRKRRARAWWEEIFDEDYLRTLPYLTPTATQREASFLVEGLAVKPGAHLLDVGCGYGRHAMELATRGFHVVGLDLSLPLLIRGADEAQRRGLTINFVHADMRELTFDAQFDGAYCVFSTFGYFDDETNRRVAGNIARALKPGARLLLEVLNRDYVVADLPARVWWEGDGCVVLEEVDFNYFNSRVVSNRSVVFEDGRQLEQEISIRLYSLHELGKLLHQAGFRVLEVSGSLATRGRFFGCESRQMLVVAERRPVDEAGETGSRPPGGP